MAATTLAGVMNGIETRLKTISGLRTSAIAADQVNPPMAIVGVPPVPSYRGSMQRGVFEINPTVHVLVSATYDRVGQMLLASYADVTGAKSIPLAIEGDRTLGGVVQDCIVVDFRPLGLDEVDSLKFYGGVFTLHVIAQGV